MKRINSKYILLITLIAFCYGCKNDVIDAGASALGEEDKIQVKADTFSVESALQKSDAISLSPDSFLLGECDTHFGTIKADLLTQFACPEGFEYPSYPNVDAPEVDSVCLYLYYQNWYGDGLAPLGITVHEMDKATLDYDTRYPNDTCLSTFCSMTDSTRISAQSRIVIAQEYTDSVYMSNNTYMPCIRIKLSDEFAKRFFAIQDFSSQEAFNQLFKGLYICTDFGGSTILYVKEISMAVFYHFSRPRTNQSDTIVNDIKLFYANSEVRQINRYTYPDRDKVLAELQQKKDTNFIISPANIYTRLSVNLDSIFHRMEYQLGGSADEYRVYVNRANLTVDVLYDEPSSSRPRDEWDAPASYMLLVDEEKMETFFAKNELPSDTTAILGTLTADVDTVGNISYNYSYDLSGLLTHQLRTKDTRASEMHFLFVPVVVQTAESSSTILSVKPMQTISTTYIRSANNSDHPMDVEVVYSRFNKLN